MMLVSLLLPIVLCGVALFFASFLSWMVVKLHDKDWRGLPREDGVMQALKDQQAVPGSYMFPWANSDKERMSPEFQARYKAGPSGVLTVMPPVSMGKNLGLTIVYFLCVSFCVGYLASFALPRGAEFLQVMRFTATTALLAYLSAILQHAIWFRIRVVGHVIESIAYALITGAIFGALWPAVTA